MSVIKCFDDFVFCAIFCYRLLCEILLDDFEVGVLGLVIEGERVSAVVAVDYLHLMDYGKL